MRRVPIAVTRPATREDVDMLSVVGPAAYAAAYGHIWEHGHHLSQFLQTFGHDHFCALLEDLSRQAWVAEMEGRTVGFLSLTLDSADPIRSRPGGAEIPRIYLLPGAQGRGIGRKLFDEAARAASAAGREYLWLDAMDSAAWAERAYVRWGFKFLGRTKFEHPVRLGLDGMIVLGMDLRPDGSA